MENSGDKPVKRFDSRLHVIKRHGCRGFSYGLLMVLLLFITATAGFAWVSMGIVAKDRWPIRWLEINGSFQRVSAEQLRASLTPLIASSFFTIDLQELRDAAGRNSWVSMIHIQKRWPDTVVVNVEEFVPFAHWNQGQLISSQGIAFSVPEADTIQGLPWLNGPQDQLPQVLKNWTKFNDELLSSGLEIQRMTLDERGSWSMLLNNGTQVQLGRNAAWERLQRLMSGWDVLLQDQAAPPRDVDLRYTNGFAVLWPGKSGKRTGKDS
jgi:cell division protein FtsQ